MTKPYETLLERRYRGEHPLLTLLHLYRRDAHKFILAMLLYIIKHSGVWAMPLLTANVIDVVSQPETRSLSELWFYAALLIVIFAQNVPTHYGFMRLLSMATRRLGMRLRSSVTRRLQHLSMNFYYRSSTGALQTKMLRDVEIIETLTMRIFETIPSASITLVFAIVVTAIRAPAFLIFFALVVPSAVIVVRSLQSLIRKRNREFREKFEGMSSSLLEMIHLIPVTRAHGVEQDQVRKIEAQLQSVEHAGVRLDSINAIFGAVSWVTFRLFETLCLIVAGYFAYTQIIPITVGDVVMLTGFFTNLANAVLQIVNILPEVTRGFESIYSLGEILESPDMEQNEGKTPVETVRGHFVFENVSFAYPDTHDSSLNDLALEVYPGEVIAIVGPSGAGKSTFLNLVIGFIRPTEGRILLDGIDMNMLDLRTYRRSLAVVPQQTILFEGSVRENIVYGMHNVDEAHVLKAMEDANAREFIEQLPDGLDTRIGENGVKLSGGQRQRLAIARALIRNPRVLILDEATSALDTASEVKIQQALKRLMQGRTTFVVAHRLSTIQNADRILVLEAGRIVEMGSHADLLKRGGVYARLHGAQFAFASAD